jgi:hypothetical protein
MKRRSLWKRIKDIVTGKQERHGNDHNNTHERVRRRAHVRKER